MMADGRCGHWEKQLLSYVRCEFSCHEESEMSKMRIYLFFPSSGMRMLRSSSGGKEEDACRYQDPGTGPHLSFFFFVVPLLAAP
jgi:hypothetical protein